MRSCISTSFDLTDAAGGECQVQAAVVQPGAAGDAGLPISPAAPAFESGSGKMTHFATLSLDGLYAYLGESLSSINQEVEVAVGRDLPVPLGSRVIANSV